MTDLERIDQEIAEAERMLREGHPDVGGLTLALFDWSTERRIVEAECRR